MIKFRSGMLEEAIRLVLKKDKDEEKRSKTKLATYPHARSRPIFIYTQQ
jgi:hypothetical protein